MDIKFKAELPDDMTERERKALLISLLGEMNTKQVAQFIYDNFGANIAVELNALDNQS